MSRFVDRDPVQNANELWRVNDEQRGGASCALRVMRLTPARSVALRTRLREVAKLHHESLARLVAVGEEDGAIVVVREWLPGPSLAVPVDVTVTCDALINVLDGLELAHWHDLTHGGITPERVLFNSDGRAALVDLGLEGQGSVQGDLRAVADVLEAATPELPDVFRSVVVRTHDGDFATARDLQSALKEARRTVLAVSAWSWGRWGLAASLLLFVTVLGVLWWQRQRPPALPPEPPPEPVAQVRPVPTVAPVAPAEPSAVAPEPQRRRRPVPAAVPKEVVVVEVQPVPDPVVRITPVPVEPAPEVVEVMEVSPPVPAPVPAPAPVAPAPSGSWQVAMGPGSGVTLRLAANNTVVARSGAGGRPVVEVVCDRGKARVALLPGVAVVESILMENGAATLLSEVFVTPQGRATQAVRWRGMEGSGTLFLPKRQLKWFRGLESATGTMIMAYTPFASESVQASFSWDGLSTALDPYRALCGFE